VLIRVPLTSDERRAVIGPAERPGLPDGQRLAS
jgi:hypothetical protein